MIVREPSFLPVPFAGIPHLWMLAFLTTGGAVAHLVAHNWFAGVLDAAILWVLGSAAILSLAQMRAVRRHAPALRAQFMKRYADADFADCAVHCTSRAVVVDGLVVRHDNLLLVVVEGKEWSVDWADVSAWGWNLTTPSGYPLMGESSTAHALVPPLPDADDPLPDRDGFLIALPAQTPSLIQLRSHDSAQLRLWYEYFSAAHAASIASNASLNTTA